MLVRSRTWNCGKVRTCFGDGCRENVVVYEALAISQYLESEYPQVPLLPASAADRAITFTRFMEVVNLCTAAMKISDLLYLEDDEVRASLCSGWFVVV